MFCFGTVFVLIINLFSRTWVTTRLKSLDDAWTRFCIRMSVLSEAHSSHPTMSRIEEILAINSRDRSSLFFTARDEKGIESLVTKIHFLPTYNHLSWLAVSSCQVRWHICQNPECGLLNSNYLHGRPPVLLRNVFTKL